MHAVPTESLLGDGENYGYPGIEHRSLRGESSSRLEEVMGDALSHIGGREIDGGVFTQCDLVYTFPCIDFKGVELQIMASLLYSCGINQEDSVREHSLQNKCSNTEETSMLSVTVISEFT